MDIKFFKDGIEIVVTQNDLREYYDYLSGKISNTRVLLLLNNNFDDYEELMGTYCQLNE